MAHFPILSCRPSEETEGTVDIWNDRTRFKRVIDFVTKEKAYQLCDKVIAFTTVQGDSIIKAKPEQARTNGWHSAVMTELDFEEGGIARLSQEKWISKAYYCRLEMIEKIRASE
eukprot:c8164_g1_i5.p1 GENE.c8164_g1_i5~~c8164_g1_i5.p1  ORF type:complete len:114 (-),score=23.64 c8164_g1_i5:4-345(-)